MSDGNSNSFLWFLGGLGIGAVVGVLYAPRSGNETREALRSRQKKGATTYAVEHATSVLKPRNGSIVGATF